MYQNFVYEIGSKFNMSLRARVVFANLIHRANSKNLTCFPALSTIAHDCGISVSTVQRAIKDLVSLGIIEVKRRIRKSDNGWTSNLYKLLIALPKKVKKYNDSNRPKEPKLSETIILEPAQINDSQAKNWILDLDARIAKVVEHQELPQTVAPKWRIISGFKKALDRLLGANFKL